MLTSHTIAEPKILAQLWNLRHVPRHQNKNPANLLAQDTAAQVSREKLLPKPSLQILVQNLDPTKQHVLVGHFLSYYSG